MRMLASFWPGKSFALVRKATVKVLPFNDYLLLFIKKKKTVFKFMEQIHVPTTIYLGIRILIHVTPNLNSQSRSKYIFLYTHL